MSAWEARGKLPLGADMTAAIQRMRLIDLVDASPERLACRGVSAEQESMLRMQYALAIIRLVNGISDSAQKGTVAKSVASQAETAGAQADAALAAEQDVALWWTPIRASTCSITPSLLHQHGNLASWSVPCLQDYRAFLWTSDTRHRTMSCPAWLYSGLARPQP